MYGFFVVIHILICVGLMIAVLLQSAKGEGLAGAFGGSSLTGTVFGGRGAAPVLAKATSGLAVAFFLSCLLLAFLSPARQVATDGTVESAIERAARERQTEVPAQATPPGEIPPQSTEGQPAQLPPTDQTTDDAAQPQVPPDGGEEQPEGQ